MVGPDPCGVRRAGVAAATYTRDMHDDLREILIPADVIRERVHALGEEIAAVYSGDDEHRLTLLPVLAGSMIFTADLIRQMPLRMKIALVQLSTYPGQATTAGEPQMIMDITGEITGRHVLIIDDILDSGRTLRRVRELVSEHQPESVRTAVLLKKKTPMNPGVEADFVGFEIEDEFVVGYGLDYDDLYRNLPFIGVLRPELM